MLVDEVENNALSVWWFSPFHAVTSSTDFSPLFIGSFAEHYRSMY